MEVETNLSREEWNFALAKLPAEAQDTYFTADYHALHAANGDGKPDCTMVRRGRAMLLVMGLQMLVPFMLAGSAMLFDLQTCSGYGGPLASSDADPEFLEEAWRCWKASSRRRGVIAAFFRMHPLLKNERFLPQDAQVITDRKTVFWDFAPGFNSLWAEADTNYRNMVHKGKCKGTRIEWNDANAWREAEALYGEAMERLGAPPSLRFSPAYFQELQKLPGAELATTRRDGRLAAFSCFLSGPKWCHYHISARSDHAENHQHTFLLHEAMRRAMDRGLCGMHLGGGRTASPDDGLFRFKRHTGGRPIDFKVALVVADLERYEALCEARLKERGHPSPWLLAYRH